MYIHCYSVDIMWKLLLKICFCTRWV